MEKERIDIEKCRKILGIEDITDSEIKQIRDSYYELTQLAFEVWQGEKFGSKNPVRSLPPKI